MINSTLIKNENKTKADLEFLLNSIYVLPQWEKIGEFLLFKKILFRTNSLRADLFRKYSPKNMIEKYCLKQNEEKALASLDLKVYKDNVYIISIDIENDLFAKEILEKFIQISAEKAFNETTNKEVKINLSFPFIRKYKVKNLLEQFGFIPEENQSKYERDMFGETFVLDVKTSDFWQQKIKNNHIV